MKQNQLGSSSLLVSEIGFGCMSLPLDDESRAQTLLRAAFDGGVSFFDTADLYGRGQNERLVGKCLKPVRNKVILATKVGNRWTDGESGWTWDASRDYILRAVEDSLMRLQTDYIDLYQLHGGTLDDDIDEVIDTFESLVQRGIIRAYGISSIRPSVIREYVRRSNIATVMSQYSLLDRRPEEAVLPLLEHAGISVIARGPMASGLLATQGKPAEQAYLGYSPDQIQDVRQKASNLRSDATLSQMAIRYALHHPTIATTIPGASRLEQLEENLGARRVPPLSSDEVSQIQSWLPANRYELHR